MNRGKSCSSNLFSSVLLLVILLSALFSSVNNSPTIQVIYGHSFTPNSLASFIASMDQFQTEVNLVNQNLQNNNSQLAQKHANEANSIYYWDMLTETAKRDKQISEEIKLDVETLQNFSSSFADSTKSKTLLQEMQEEEKLKFANQLVTNINTNIDSMINTTKNEKQISDSNILNQITLFLSNLFTGQETEQNESIQPMRFIELVDEVLRNYGDAFNVDFDMTDMSNMARTINVDGSSTNLNNAINSSHSMHSTSAMMSMHPNASPIVEMANYQSALGLTQALINIFSKDIRPLIADDDSLSNYRVNIENSLSQLHDSIENKASPMDVMMIVHTKVHPNLMEAFGLQLV